MLNFPRRTRGDTRRVRCGRWRARRDHCSIRVLHLAANPEGTEARACSPTKGRSCLSQAQIDVLARVYGGPKDSAGKALYSDWPLDAGLAATLGASGRSVLRSPASRASMSAWVARRSLPFSRPRPPRCARPASRLWTMSWDSTSTATLQRSMRGKLRSIVLRGRPYRLAHPIWRDSAHMAER